jgi:hypothetical protein
MLSLYWKNKEKTFITAGPEFGDQLQGRILIVQGGWYGHKSAAATFHEHLSTKLRMMRFRPTLTDQNLWIRKRNRRYDYLASYVDDVIIISQDPMNIIEDLKRTYVLKAYLNIIWEVTLMPSRTSHFLIKESKPVLVLGRTSLILLNDFQILGHYRVSQLGYYVGPV